jgi:large subunit ribosomal protein L9
MEDSHMKVLLRQNVAKLGHIGDVVEVRPGYARNYLVPRGLATMPTEANLKAVEAAKQAYLAELAQQHAELEARAKLLEGKEVTITARANEEGHLYGSVGPAQIAAELAKQGAFVEPENIALDEPIRRLDKYEVPVRFAEDVQTTIGVWVVPPRDVGEGEDEQAAEDESKRAEGGEQDAAAQDGQQQ